ncbi:MAG: CHASE2 domain-containing protein, partial [Candidatus Omnitrophota bacterium]
MKKNIPVIFLSLFFAVCLFFLQRYIPLLNCANLRIYDTIQKMHYKLSKPPAAINDILLVTIDNPTLTHIPERWPYPRSYFAKVINNLKKAGIKVIAFDFVFYGRTTPEEDELITKAVGNDQSIILASSIDEEGFLNIFPFAHLEGNFNSGIITKVQDADGVVRKNITYLVSEKERQRGFLSWEMAILKTVRNINLSSIESYSHAIAFENYDRERWAIPVDEKYKSFLINYRAHTKDFRRISFYKVLNGELDENMVKGKIALVGLVSSLFADIHNTPIGWLPGITLNANAFLTLHSKNFLKELPPFLNIIVLLIGVFIAAFFYVSFERKKALFLLTGEVFVFFLISYILFILGYVWHYALPILAIFCCPILSKYIYSKKNKIPI